MDTYEAVGADRTVPGATVPSPLSFVYLVYFVVFNSGFQGRQEGGGS
jgi:hypothetical protein